MDMSIAFEGRDKGSIVTASVVDLKFLPGVRPARVGTSNPKPH
jgi:hypothetical protein